MPVFEPKKLRDNKIWGIVHEPKIDQKEFRTLKELVSADVEMLVFVGYPASGKSTVARRLAEEECYVHINQDTLGSLEKCAKKAEDELSRSKSVIIDNTNFVEDQRKRFETVFTPFGVQFTVHGIVDVEVSNEVKSSV